jgi:UDP-2,3-diacylglucosamine pyrophosphatase LpxH
MFPKYNFEPVVPDTIEKRRPTKTVLESAIQTVQDSGFFVSKKPLQRGYSFDLDVDHHHGKVYKFGLVSDPHLGSKYQQLDSLWQFYQYCDSEGIRDVFMAGDLSDGFNMYNGHIFELAVHGERAQANYIIENYPKFDDITTTFIGGNHDEAFWKKNGSDICYDVALERPDLVYKGYYLANFNVGGINICLHHGDGGVAYARCFDKETEIFTKERGWVKFCDLTTNEQVATLNLEMDEFEWQKPTEYTNQPYNGDMIHFKTRSIDLLVTPDHRMLVKRSESVLGKLNRRNGGSKEYEMPSKSHPTIDRNWQVVSAADLYDDHHRQRWAMKRTASNWKGNDCSIDGFVTIPDVIYGKYNKYGKGENQSVNAIQKMDLKDAISVIAWYATEGSLSSKSVCISQSLVANPDNHRAICELFDRIGYRYFTSDRSINIASKQLSGWLDLQCGHGSRNKHLPDWVKQLPKSYLDIVFSTMIKGDGWIDNKGFGYKSISKQLRDDIQEIAFKLGYACTENGDGIRISRIQIEPTINDKPTVEHYEGNIYCVSVPNTFILVRRNGRAAWSGNSYQPQKLALSKIADDQIKNPDILVIGHYHAMCILPKYINMCIIQMPCFQGMTPAYMGRKGLSPDIGGIVLEVEEKNGTVLSIKTQYVGYKAKENDY